MGRLIPASPPRKQAKSERTFGFRSWVFCGAIAGAYVIKRSGDDDLWKDSYQIVVRHPEVQKYIGTEIVRIERDSSVGVDTSGFVKSSAEGKDIRKIKFTLSGSRGEGVVYAAIPLDSCQDADTASQSQFDLLYSLVKQLRIKLLEPTKQLHYLIFQDSQTKEVITLIDHGYNQHEHDATKTLVQDDSDTTLLIQLRTLRLSDDTLPVQSRKREIKAECRKRGINV